MQYKPHLQYIHINDHKFNLKKTPTSHAVINMYIKGHEFNPH
jgi:hypothetical protein